MSYLAKTAYVAISWLLLSAATAAFAYIPVIEDISKNSYNVIRYINRSSEAEMSLDSAKKVKRAVMANTLLDAGEKQMLSYLQNDQSFSIRLPNSNNITSYTKPVSEEAKSFLSAIAGYSYLDPVEEMWMSGTDADIKRFVEIHQSSAEGEKRVDGFLSRQLANHPEPKVVLRQWAANLYNVNDSVRYTQLKKLLYKIAVIEDKKQSLSGTTDGGIADREYSFLKDK